MALEKSSVLANFTNCKIVDFRLVDTGMLSV